MKMNSLGYRVIEHDLTNSQNEALHQTREWYKAVVDRRANQLFFIAGYAGTGKSTITPVILTELGIQAHHVAFMTYTGKASRVLAQKTGVEVTTIHSRIYRQNEITKDWELKNSSDNELYYKKLIVMDEVSMLNKAMMADVMSFGIPILCFGDPGQLPPVGGEPYFDANCRPDVFMTEITRQALESPIIEVAHRLREGRGVLNGTYGSEVWVGSRREFDHETFHCADQVICGRNDTRISLNKEMRKELGFCSEDADILPLRGEKLICLKNNHKLGVMNGQVFYASSNAENLHNSSTTFLLSLVEHTCRLEGAALEEHLIGDSETDMNQRLYKAEIFNGYLHRHKLDDSQKLPPSIMRTLIELDYAYAITTHKAQGSQWDRVLMVNEPPFRERDLNNRWAYTSVTRAAKMLCILN